MLGFFEVNEIVWSGTLGRRYAAQLHGAVSFEFGAHCFR